jgi:uncharacterized membrane protein YhhN
MRAAHHAARAARAFKPFRSRLLAQRAASLNVLAGKPIHVSIRHAVPVGDLFFLSLPKRMSDLLKFLMAHISNVYYFVYKRASAMLFELWYLYFTSTNRCIFQCLGAILSLGT